MTIRIDVQNTVIGRTVFWQGSAEQLSEITSIPARYMAEKVVRDGQSRNCGMWFVSVVSQLSG